MNPSPVLFAVKTLPEGRAAGGHEPLGDSVCRAGSSPGLLGTLRPCARHLVSWGPTAPQVPGPSRSSPLALVGQGVEGEP